MEPKYEEGQNGRQTWWRWSDKRVLAQGTGFRGKIRVSGRSREAETQVEPGLLPRDLTTGRGLTDPVIFKNSRTVQRFCGETNFRIWGGFGPLVFIGGTIGERQVA